MGRWVLISYMESEKFWKYRNSIDTPQIVSFFETNSISDPDLYLEERCYIVYDEKVYILQCVFHCSFFFFKPVFWHNYLLLSITWCPQIKKFYSGFYSGIRQGTLHRFISVFENLFFRFWSFSFLCYKRFKKIKKKLHWYIQKKNNRLLYKISNGCSF